VTTSRGGRRQGAGRKAKPLIDLVEAGTFSVTRHGRLLWTDDSLLEAAAARPDDDGLQRLAEINRVARDRGGSRHTVTWFSRTLRGLREEETKTMQKSGGSLEAPHKIDVRETFDADGALLVEARAEGTLEPAITIRIVRDQLCPHCVGTVLRGVIERYEDTPAATPGHP
jgi:hypothetical protein